MDSIDLINFLRNYYGIVSDDLKVNRLTHIDVKILFPNIKRSSFAAVDNDISLVYSGEVIMVYDCYGNILPYINPHLEIEDLMENTFNYEEEQYININYLDLDNLSKDELLKLRKLLKNNGQRSDEKRVVRAIVNKKDYQVMEYKIKKRLLKMEEL